MRLQPSIGGLVVPDINTGTKEIIPKSGELKNSSPRLNTYNLLIKYVSHIYLTLFLSNRKISFAFSK